MSESIGFNKEIYSSGNPELIDSYPKSRRPYSAGENTGKFTIISHIASGGMAEIYKVRNNELEVIRAVKILKPGASEECRERFLTEAKISANFSHPNIVHIYNVETGQNSISYIEMEYLECSSLAEFISRDKRLPLDFTIAVCAYVCDALEYAQNQELCVYGRTYNGVVHRDIKPGNILVTNDGVVKLADFGIALPGNVSIHSVGPTTMGTYAYISPEQLDGKRLDQRSDIYSIGIVLYESITGVKPFPTRTLPELIHSKQNGTYRPVRSLAPHIPKKFVEIIDICLSKNIADRYSSCAELGKTLRDFLEENDGVEAGKIINRFINKPEPIPGSGLKTKGFIFKPGWVAPVTASIIITALAAFFIVSNKQMPKMENNVQVKRQKVISSPEVDRKEITEIRTGEPIDNEKNNFAQAVITTDYKKEDKGHSVKPSRVRPPITAGVVRSKVVSRQLPVLPDTNNAQIRLRMLEKYIDNREYEKAIAFAENRTIDDGYFYLLKGRAFISTGDFEQAETELNLAQTRPSIYNSNTREDAAYQWALNRVAVYKKKPNLDNKKLAVRALANYSLAFCSEKMEERKCRSAQGIIKELDR